MPEVVKVSTVENNQDLMTLMGEYFKEGRYAEITQAIGMHSILIDSEHTTSDQTRLYRSVLNMIKDKERALLGAHYSPWYAKFPKLMDELIAAGAVDDRSAAEAMTSHRSAFGQFKSLDDFFFWSLDDRRLTLDLIVRYIEKTTAMPCQ